MALVANYEMNGELFKNAYFQIRRVWGSKAEGWNATIGVALTPLAAKDNVFIHEFEVHTDYVEAIPFPLLYEATRSYLKDRKVKAKDHLTKVAEPKVKKEATEKTVNRKMMTVNVEDLTEEKTALVNDTIKIVSKLRSRKSN